MVDLPALGKGRRIKLEGEAGAIETLIEAPEAEPRGVAVICHPHPLYGGALENKVTYILARVYRDAGFLSARFNFRGVGDSEGEHDEGRGETDDALAVCEHLLAGVDSDEVVLAGFSFGAGVALRAAALRTPSKLVTVALPVEYFADNELPRPDCDWLAVHGDADDVVDCDVAVQRLNQLKPPPEIVVIKDAGHFFHGRLKDVGQIVAPFLPD